MWDAVCLSKSAQNQFIVNTCQYIYLHWGNGFCWLFSTGLMPLCQICKSNVTTTVFLAEEIWAVTGVPKNVCLSLSPDSIYRHGYEIVAFFFFFSQRINSATQAEGQAQLTEPFGHKLSWDALSNKKIVREHQIQQNFQAMYKFRGVVLYCKRKQNIPGWVSRTCGLEQCWLEGIPKCRFVQSPTQSRTITNFQPWQSCTHQRTRHNFQFTSSINVQLPLCLYASFHLPCSVTCNPPTCDLEEERRQWQAAMTLMLSYLEALGSSIKSGINKVSLLIAFAH